MKKELKFDELMAKLKEQDNESKAFFGEAEMIADVVNELIEARVKRGWTQRDLANKTGLKQPAIARLERLDAIPGLEIIAKIALQLGVKLSLQDSNKQNKYICLPKTEYLNEDVIQIFTECDSNIVVQVNGKESSKWQNKNA